jgi:CubicO group peptidase (beta-lactamase class C family)
MDALRGVALKSMETWSVPGMAIGVETPEGREVLPLGVTALDTEFPVRPDTLFQIGSISKPFTATLLMCLVEDGQIDLDVPVTTYVPGLRLGDPAAPGKVTARHLLTHQAGFWGDWFDDFGMADDAIERFVAAYADLPQMFEPGTMWAYNNCGYILAGLIAARVTGQTFEDALRERVIEPLGLDHTVLSAAEAIAFPVAVGHTLDPETREARIARQFLRPRARNPAGGVLASVEDVLTFARSFLNLDGALLSQATVAAMRERQVETYEAGAAWGLGFKVDDYGGTEVVGHGGATNGFRALLQMAPDHGLAVAVLTNGDGGSQAAGEVSDWILGQRLGIAPRELPGIEASPIELEQLGGTYEQPYATLGIRVTGHNVQGRLITHSPYSEQDEEQVGDWIGLRPVGEDRFVVESGDLRDAQLKFWKTGFGAVRFAQLGGRMYVPGSWEHLMGETK